MIFPEVTIKRISAILLAVILAAGTVILPLPVAAAGSGAGTWYVKTLTINAGQVPSAQTDFPLLVSLVNDSDLQTHAARADGGDIVFTDSGNTIQYAHEIEKWDAATGTLVAWVKVPSVADGTIVKMWYGVNTGAPRWNPSGVWDASFKGVWHMAQLNPLDSTVNGNNGTATVTGVTANFSGKINGDNSFDITNVGSIDCGNASSLNFIAGGTYTWEAWVNPTASVTSGEGIIGKFNGSSTAPQGYEINISGGGSGSSKFRVQTATSAGTGVQLNSAANVVFGNWYHLAVTWNNGNVNLYLNGLFDSSMAMTGQDNTADNVYIGWRRTGSHFYGQIDEVKYSTTLRSSDWLRTEYNNQSAPGAFYAVGTEQVVMVTAPWTLNIVNGATTYTVTQSEFEAMPQSTINVTDMHGTHDWTGVPVWRLLAKNDGDGDANAFNETLAATNYGIKNTATDGYMRCSGPTATGTTIAHNDELIVANLMDGAPIIDTQPLKIVGTTLISSHFVSRLASIELVYIINVTPKFSTPTPNGAVNPIGNTADIDGVVGVSFGANQSFSITGNPGYHPETLTIDGSPVTVATSYTFNNVNANHSIAATFAADPGVPFWDLNGDHVCNIGDVVIIGLKWGLTGTPGWIPEDLSPDGVINIGDVVVLGLHWGQSW